MTNSDNPATEPKPNGSAEPTPNMPDPFDPEAFRMPPDGEPVSGVVIQPIKLKVRKPRKTEFIRTHPTLRMRASVLEQDDGMDKTYCLAMPIVAALSPGEFRTVELCLTINRDGALFLWPIPQPDENGKANDWNTSARDGAHQALAKWVRLKADKANSQYTIMSALSATIPEPKWPDETLASILERAFGKDGVITDETHPGLKALRGE